MDKNNFFSLKNISIKTLYLSIFSGITTGIAVSIFRIFIPKVMELSKHILSAANNSLLNSLFFILFFIGLGLLVSLFTHIEPMIGGSGIPQVSGILSNKLKMSWIKIFICKLLGGIISIGSGLTLGREGPSVQIGASIGQGISETFSLKNEERNNLIAGSAGAGMAVAFNAPISGIIFSIEELLHKTNSKQFIQVSVTVLIAVLTSLFILGSSPAIPIETTKALSINKYTYLIGLGILIGLSGVIFNRTILFGKSLYSKWNAPNIIKHLFPFLVTALLLLINSDLLGSGENLISESLKGQSDVYEFAIVFTTKLILVTLAFCSGIPGGIFFPLLALGSLIGNIYGSILYSYGLCDMNTIVIFTLISMSAHFSSIVRAPLTGIFLILEMTQGGIAYLLPIALTSLVAYLTAEILKSEPIYESLLYLMTESNS